MYQKDSRCFINVCWLNEQLQQCIRLDGLKSICTSILGTRDWHPLTKEVEIEMKRKELIWKIFWKKDPWVLVTAWVQLIKEQIPSKVIRKLSA